MGDKRETVGADHVFASAKEFELLDISTVDHVVAINEGVAFAVNCENPGNILKIDTGVQIGYTTLALKAGINLITCTKIYRTGSTVTGAVELQAW